MYDRFLHHAKMCLADINNFLKSDSEIGMDFRLRLDVQTTALDESVTDTISIYNKAVSMHEMMLGQSPRKEDLLFLEENY